jgi:hydroxyethylthiazole kinase-like uncharacterized protein yjeF
MRTLTKQILRKLKLPRPDSHKGENGQLLIIAGSRHYHGSLLFAVRAASRIVDKIHVLTSVENKEVVQKLRVKTAAFIPSYDLKHALSLVDCVLIGPGMGTERRTKKLVESVLRSGKRVVLDADALNVLDAKLLKLLGPQHIVTPHQGEFRRAFGLAPTWQNVKKVADTYHCTVVLKGKIDVISSPQFGMAFNKTGNQGMTKGGTGDVLAGLIASFYCKNGAYISAAAGIFVNGLAGDVLFSKGGPFYNAEDLVEQIPKTLWKAIK